MIVGAKDGGIAFLMGKRQVGPEEGTWFFPSDELEPGEKVEDCVQRVLESVGWTLPDRVSPCNKILDQLPAQTLVSMDDTLPETMDEDQCKLSTVFAYCLIVDVLDEVEPDTKYGGSEDEETQKMDRLAYFNWYEIEDMCKREKSRVPFTALRNFIRKWHNVDWDRNPWGASI
ncbi:hypothetical protein F5883DRAFT_522440 [Diaporthe sp. PMI_573]|nr:hypothetical protein F5883DRAFT_522440 [Diaporthaceae sp. PMI_573]